MSVKSPFYIISEFISPLLCEQIVDDLDFYIPDTDPELTPQKMFKSHERSEAFLFDRIDGVVSQLEQYYGFEYKGTEPMQFEWFPQESSGNFVCENSNYLRKKWVRTKTNDFTGLLFLSDFQPTIPFDSDYEVMVEN